MAQYSTSEDGKGVAFTLESIVTLWWCLTPGAHTCWTQRQTFNLAAGASYGFPRRVWAPHLARRIPEQFRQAVEKELTGKGLGAVRDHLLQAVQESDPVIEQAIETAALMLG